MAWKSSIFIRVSYIPLYRFVNGILQVLFSHAAHIFIYPLNHSSSSRTCSFPIQISRPVFHFCRKHVRFCTCHYCRRKCDSFCRFTSYVRQKRQCRALLDISADMATDMAALFTDLEATSHVWGWQECRIETAGHFTATRKHPEKSLNVRL